MWTRFKKLFIDDFNIISQQKTLYVSALILFILFILLKFIFPPLSHFIFSKSGFVLDNYYSLVAITFVAIIPALVGIIYAHILLNEKSLPPLTPNEITPAIKRNILYMRMIISSFLSFVLLLLTIILTKPVPTEGWLRTLLAAILFSIQAPLVSLFIIVLSKNRVAGVSLSWLWLIFLIAVPFGLLVHHPWNYLVFCSPLYWITWAWIVPSPLESLVYGIIALFLSAVILIFLSGRKLKVSFG